MDLLTVLVSAGVAVLVFGALPATIIVLVLHLMREQRAHAAGRARPLTDAERGAEVVRSRFARGEITEEALDSALWALGVPHGGSEQRR